MPIHLTSISNTFFTSLLARLGVRPPPADGFDLINTVQPISLVDSDIVLPVFSSSIALDLPFTEGDKTAPAASALLADTLAQPGGTYNLYVQIGHDIGGSFGLAYELARRNAANNADIWMMKLSEGSAQYSTLDHQLPLRVVLGVNERIVVRVGAQAVGAGETVRANIWLST